ncbi:MAG: histidine--tRNA ligase [Aminobacterium sp.]|jgi:histidyl-tRNA synthetase|nr:MULTISPECIES: histidine--tRNA ligase [unclassified Aminobacterium]MDD2206760.1 histidine--tRNA ligase [Aminobacterium sp.]MDD3426917.1 histidine--tRNA ligase [Aminobacterium sp.]MDD3707804.1 histidine--tRNA ligase [Aminobacterium sp.]MDD4229130.1 histidine--tRNA ligase [Aminobacterium sp.]MDD4552058.1 histidine--tRNA ligase [Aminobacterium sp.]
MVDIKAPRGVRDILPEESWKWAYVLNVAAEVARDFGYSEVHLPIFEHTELFSRGIGETTDVVEKEMYTFEDRGGRSLTLRPEATASMIRCYLENKLNNGAQPVKLWCAGPMFRYERPQKGRYRQFWQLDFESIGSENPMIDVEVIALSLELYRRLGLQNLEVVINSVGCPECRPTYREKLKEYFKPQLDKLCKTCQSRFDRNPLRILDCKNPDCKEITEGAPDIYSSLCDDCRSHFDKVQERLNSIGAHFHIDKRLVRGLDYYTKTAYEVLSGALGAQNAVCGGGRYDNLAETIGGPSTPSVGFAAGLERIVLVMEEQNCSFGARPDLDVYAIGLDEVSREELFKILTELRQANIAADMDYMGRGMKAQFKSAAASGARFACILGGDELAKGVVNVKDLETGEQEEVKRATILNYIQSKL